MRPDLPPAASLAALLGDALQRPEPWGRKGKGSVPSSRNLESSARSQAPPTEEASRQAGTPRAGRAGEEQPAARQDGLPKEILGSSGSRDSFWEVQTVAAQMRLLPQLERLMEERAAGWPQSTRYPASCEAAGNVVQFSDARNRTLTHP